MSDLRYVLAIDLGTGGPKVALVGSDGRIAARTNRAVETKILPPLGAEQDPEEIWRAVLDGARQVLREAGKPAESVAGILCASQYFSIVPVDRNGHAVMNLLLWLDRRGYPYPREIFAAQPESLFKWVEIHGAAPLGNDSLSHMLWVQKERPREYERTHAFLEPVDYVNTRLTGRISANMCTAFPLLLTDNRDLGSLDYSPELLAFSGIDREKLPSLIPVDSVIGTLLPEVARELGLSPSTPVFSGINDTQAVTMGTGTFRRGRGGLNVGTTIQVLSHASEKNTDIENQIVSMPSPIPNQYLAMAEIGLGGKLVEHFVRNFVYASDALGDHAVEDPFAQIDASVREVEPGSGGVLYLPWLTGAQAPRENSRMRGGFLNVSLGTTRAHLLRAVLEGVAYQLRWMVPAVEKFSSQTFASLHFSGGGATSEEWAQIMADVMGRPIHQLDDARQGNTRGAAFVAFLRLGIASEDSVDAFCPIRRVYEPRPDAAARHDAMFEQFVHAFERTEPIFEALNQ